jgi:homoserine O-acetyltransferase
MKNMPFCVSQRYAFSCWFSCDFSCIHHHIIGNASLHTWWGDLLGPGRPFDTDKYFVVCANSLGSCYGSTSPASMMPGTNPPRPYGFDFPDVSLKDTVKLQLHMLRDHLNIHSIKSVIGGSFGGMQAVEFAAQGGTIESEFAVNDSNGM